jgi:hypothetical protein
VGPHTASIDSTSDPGRLKKNFERSNTPSVDLTRCALEAFSNIGRKTWSALALASVCCVQCQAEELARDLGSTHVLASHRNLVNHIRSDH